MNSGVNIPYAVVEEENEFQLIEIKKKQELTKERLEKIERATLAASFLESVNMTSIYFMFITEFLHKLFEEFSRIAFPIAAIFPVLKAGFHWAVAYLKKGESRSVIHAVVETVAAVGIVIAVVGAMAAAAVFGAVAPMIFTAISIAKSVFFAGLSIYNAVKAATIHVPEYDPADEEQVKNAQKAQAEKEQYQDQARDYGISAAAGAVASAAVIGVFLLAHAALAVVGIVSSLFGAGFALYKAIVADDKPETPITELVKGEDDQPDDLVEDPEFVNTYKPTANITIVNTKEKSSELSEKSPSGSEHNSPEEIKKTKHSGSFNQIAEYFQKRFTNKVASEDSSPDLNPDLNAAPSINVDRAEQKRNQPTISSFKGRLLPGSPVNEKTAKSAEYRPTISSSYH